MKTQIVLSGVGGQGLISTGEIICQAAALFENGLNATMAASYGSETRGTFTKSDVIVSDEPIGYPNVETPDVILCLAQVAYDKYIDQFEDHTKIFYDTELVKPAEGAKGIMDRCSLLHRDSVAQAIAHRFAGKQKAIDLNIKALDLGLSLK